MIHGIFFASTILQGWKCHFLYFFNFATNCRRGLAKQGAGQLHIQAFSVSVKITLVLPAYFEWEWIGVMERRALDFRSFPAPHQKLQMLLKRVVTFHSPAAASGICWRQMYAARCLSGRNPCNRVTTTAILHSAWAQETLYESRFFLGTPSGLLGKGTNLLSYSVQVDRIVMSCHTDCWGPSEAGLEDHLKSPKGQGPEAGKGFGLCPHRASWNNRFEKNKKKTL